LITLIQRDPYILDRILHPSVRLFYTYISPVVGLDSDNQTSGLRIISFYESISVRLIIRKRKVNHHIVLLLQKLFILPD